MDDPEYLEGFRTAPIIVAICMYGGAQLVPLWGKEAYIAAGGPEHAKEIPSIQDGPWHEDSPLPLGTFLTGFDPRSDDLEVLVFAVLRLHGRCDYLPQNFGLLNPPLN